MGNSQTLDRKMLTAATTGSATFTQKKLPGFVGAGVDTAPTATFNHPQQGLTHSIVWAAGVTSGTVVIEEAADSADAGTWAPIATIVNNGTGGYEDYVYQPGQPKTIRHRISVTVAGGGSPSVTTRIYGVPA
jgi:hypothetical protein